MSRQFPVVHPSMTLSDPGLSAIAPAPFRGPVGTGTETPAFDGDAWYAFGGGFGYYQENGGSNGNDYHIAEDWNLNDGGVAEDAASAYAFGAGTVAFSGSMSGYGPFTVILDHTASGSALNNGHLYSLYGHMDDSYVALGETVAVGAPVGSIGAEGTSAVHLHFELFEAQSYVTAINLSGGWLLDSELAAAQNVTFDPSGTITSVTLGSGDTFARYFSSDYLIGTAADRVRTYDYDHLNSYVAGQTFTGQSYEIFGLDGNDQIIGSENADLLSGGSEHDQLWGIWGADAIYGDSGNDTLGGVLGDFDTIYGGDGQDVLFSAGGGDVLVGGAILLPHLRGAPGSDLTPGDGFADTFVFGPLASGPATIQDFEAGIDRIDLSWLALGMSDVTVMDVAGVTHVVVGYLDVVLEGVAAASVTAADFIFAC